MMSAFTRTLPPTNETTRRRLYEGEIFLLPATACSKQLVDAALDEIRSSLNDCEDPRTAQFQLSGVEFFERAGVLRKCFYTDTRFHRLVADLIAELGFSVESTGFDPARLRVVSHEGHQNPAAVAMYYGHRDTWYANPQSMITWWLPLHDVGAAESFEFFPECFGQAVGNDSEIFNFDRWVEGGSDKLIGWQNANTGLTAQYPQLLEEPSGTALPVECRRGDILLFAGQHLHRTQKQATHLTRFSLDFRTVDLNDHESGYGAVNVDNRSTGSWLKKFVPLNTVPL